jgi:3-methyladenine DNA glycosylase/8-oxoguanine DNA glycosylase
VVELTFLPANGAFDAATAFGYLVRHAIPGVERIDLARMTLTRLLPTGAGPIATTVTLSPDGVAAELPGSTHDPPGDLLHLVTGWFDLDTDLGDVSHVLDADPVLAAIGEIRPGLRLLGYPDPYEATIATVLGQQVSVRAAGTFAGRLVSAYGRPGSGGLSRLPDPKHMAEIPLGELQQAVGVTHSRARTLHAVARLFAGGFELTSEPGSRQALLDLPGIGPWTVDYLAMRALHDRDACPAGDLVLRRALGLDKPADVLDRAEKWRPFRAYAVMRLWTAAVTGLPVSPAGGAG